MIKMSLTRKLIVVFSAILIAVVTLNMAINSLLLAKVYRDDKINAMEDLYHAIFNEYSTSAELNSVIEIVKDTLSKENLRVFIWNDNDRLIIDSLPLSNFQDSDKQGGSIEDTFRDNKAPMFDDKRKNPRFGRLEGFLLYSDIKEDDIISETDGYVIFSFTSLEQYDEETLCLRSVLPGNYKLLIQMPCAPIDEAATMTNRLLLFIGTIMLVAGIIIVAVTSRTIARPVNELSMIAKGMEQLDFSRKYGGKRRDEIGSLGESINSLSAKLEKTINELYDKNEKLLSDIELKSQIDSIRKEFIANASHELKTPLALIMGYAEGLRDNIADSEEARAMYTDVICEEADKMDKIIRQMLDLMELDSSDKPLDAREVSLSMIAQEAIDSFELMFKGKEIAVSLRMNDECTIVGDYMRIYQAVCNYISNAINHVDDKNIINISVTKEGNKAKFAVYNSGVNISEDETEKIWERFYKVDKAHSREYGGSGLGLSIVRSVIEQHGGEYGFTNHADGVEFYFTLDLQNEERNNEI